MTIMPISSVRPTNIKRITFTNNNDNNKNLKSSRMNSSSSLLKAAPVILLMMSPYVTGYAEGAAPINDQQTPATTVVTKARKPNSHSKFVNDGTKTPYGWEIFDLDDIMEVYKVRNSICEFDMIFTNNRVDDQNSISNVYFVEETRDNPAGSALHPPKLNRLVHHTGGDFYGVLVNEDLVDEDGNYKGSLKSEIQIDDNTAEILLRLLTGQSQWSNATGANVIETKSSDLIPPKRY